MFNFTEDIEKFSLKYSQDDIPEDYDISEMMFTYDFVYLVYKRDASIEKAIEAVAREHGLSEEYLMDYLVKNNYLLNKANRNVILKQLKKFNTKSLKKMLKSHGLKASGKREKIEQKIIDNHLIGADYYLSSKSKIFYKNKRRRMDIFNSYLIDNYYFDEFNEYYMDNYRKKENRIPIDYVNQHIQKAIEEKNHRNYAINVEILAEIYYDYDDYKRMLENVLKVYCVNINPVWKIDDLSDHGGLAVETYDCLSYLNEIIGKNRIISAFSYIWDSFNFESFIVSKYIAYRYLKNILNDRDYFKIIEELDEKYYSNEDLKIKKVVQKTLFDF